MTINQIMCSNPLNFIQRNHKILYVLSMLSESCQHVLAWYSFSCLNLNNTDVGGDRFESISQIPFLEGKTSKRRALSRQSL